MGGLGAKVAPAGGPPFTGQADLVAGPGIASGSGTMVDARLSMPADVSRILSGLADEMGIDPGEVVLRGIALLRAARDAKNEGKAVGTADSADALDTEFVGF